MTFVNIVLVFGIFLNKTPNNSEPQHPIQSGHAFGQISWLVELVGRGEGVQVLGELSEGVVEPSNNYWFMPSYIDILLSLRYKSFYFSGPDIRNANSIIRVVSP